MRHRVPLVMALSRGSRVCYRTELDGSPALVEGIVLATIRQEYVVLVAGTAASTSPLGEQRRLGSASYVRVRVRVADVRVMDPDNVIAELAALHDLTAVAFPIARGEVLDAALALYGDGAEEYASLTEDGESSPRPPSGRAGTTPSPDSFIHVGEAAPGDTGGAAVLALLREIREEARATAVRVTALESGPRPPSPNGGIGGARRDRNSGMAAGGRPADSGPDSQLPHAPRAIASENAHGPPLAAPTKAEHAS